MRMNVELLLLHKRVCDTTMRDVWQLMTGEWLVEEGVVKATVNSRTENTQ